MSTRALIIGGVAVGGLLLARRASAFSLPGSGADAGGRAGTPRTVSVQAVLLEVLRRTGTKNTPDTGTPTMRNRAKQVASGRQLIYSEPRCSTVGQVSTSQLVAGGVSAGTAGLAGTGALIGGATAAVAGVAVPVAGAGLAIFSIFQAHARAVAAEQTGLCAAVPAANQAVTEIKNALRLKQINAAQAQQALDNVASGFRQFVSSIYKDCNAACLLYHDLLVLVEIEKAEAGGAVIID